MSSPKNRIVPDEGGKSPVMQLNSVVLPAPFEPSTARRSPGRTVMVTSVSAASAPNIRVTPRSSSAAPAPTVNRRWATLSMAVSIGAGRGAAGAAAPVFPESDHAVRRPEHDGEEAKADQKPEAIAVEAELDKEVERKGTQDHQAERADEGADRPRDATDHGDDQDVDTGSDADRARRNLTVVPDLQNPAQSGDEGRDRIGCHPMRVDIEAERSHAARVVAHALQGEAERRAREILDREIAQRRDPERQVIERDVGTPVDAEKMRGGDGVDAGMAAEDRPVLVGEVVKCGADRQRDHDGVDALGAHRERAAQRAEYGRKRQRDRGREPPRPAHAYIG